MEEIDKTMEQLRLEYETLKLKLSNQEIVNDRLMRETMKSKVRSIRSVVRISLLCGIFVMITAPFIFRYNPVINASWAFIIGTELLMALAVVLDIRFNYEVQNTDLASCDLLTFSKKVKKLKQNYSNWIKYGITLAIGWVAWLSLETWHNSSNQATAMFMIAGMCTGLVLGGILGWKMNRKIIKTCDDLISQIESES